MRAASIAALLVVACGGAPPPEQLPAMKRAKRPEPAQPPAATTRSVTPDARLNAQWRDLGITGANWKASLDAIAPDERLGMAIHLLRQGNFACPALPLRAGECPGEELLTPVTAESTFDDPCLRRLLAMWAIDRLGDEQRVLVGMYDFLVPLVQLPPPERELGAAALAKMPSGYHVASALWEAKAAGNRALVASRPLDDLDPSDLRAAASEFHLDAAVLALDPVQEDSIYLDAINDAYLMPATRLRAIALMLEAARARTDAPLVEQVVQALSQATSSDDCSVAAAAGVALEELGEGEAAVPQGPFRTEEEVIRSACSALALGRRGKAWKQVISKHGVVTERHRIDPFRADALWTQYPFAYDDDLDGAPDVPEADPDGDGDVATTLETDRKRWGPRFTLPFADELKLALPNCEGVVCRVPGTTVWFELDIGKERGTKLRLRGVERHEKIGSDC